MLRLAVVTAWLGPSAAKAAVPALATAKMATPAPIRDRVAARRSMMATKRAGVLEVWSDMALLLERWAFALGILDKWRLPRFPFCAAPGVATSAYLPHRLTEPRPARV